MYRSLISQVLLSPPPAHAPPLSSAFPVLQPGFVHAHVCVLWPPLPPDCSDGRTRRRSSCTHLLSPTFRLSYRGPPPPPSKSPPITTAPTYGSRIPYIFHRETHPCSLARDLDLAAVRAKALQPFRSSGIACKRGVVGCCQKTLRVSARNRYMPPRGWDRGGKEPFRWAGASGDRAGGRWVCHVQGGNKTSGWGRYLWRYIIGCGFSVCIRGREGVRGSVRLGSVQVNRTAGFEVSSGLRGVLEEGTPVETGGKGLNDW